MGSPVKPIVNIFETGADLIKGRKSSSALEPIKASDVPLMTIDELLATPVTKVEYPGAPRKDIDRNIFSDYDEFTEKMTTPLSELYKNQTKSEKTIDQIMKQDYTGKVQTIKPKTPYPYVREEFIGPKKEKVIVARGHVAQTNVRPKPVAPNTIDKDTYDIIKQVSDEDGFITPKSEITGAQDKIASLSDVDDYLKHCKKRFKKSHLPGSLKIHGDFIVPPEYRYMVDFQETFPYYTQAGKETKFSKHHEGFLTNFIRNNSYHNHYEGLLY